MKIEKIGIMQGRLSEKEKDVIQFFPLKNWEKEFTIAAEVGFSHIEWVVDSQGCEINPLFIKNEWNKIKKITRQNNISIPAVCHDLLINFPLQSINAEVSKKSFSILDKTIEACDNLGIKFIEIPLVGNASLKNKKSYELLLNVLSKFNKKAERSGVTFVLETDLKPSQNVILMEMMDGLPVGLNFDMGNSSYWGFDPDNEIPKIGPWIKNVHIKDCTPEDYTLPLGKGNVDFDKVFSLLKSQNYNGLFILQAAPAKNGDEKKISKQYLDFSQKYIY